jgi:uncharacterized small protein (DUF1192 family)
MSVKELNEIGRKDLSLKLRTEIALKTRDFKDAIKSDRSFTLETFNNKDVFRSPDKVGITFYHPNKEKPTHIFTKIYDISIGEKEMARQMIIFEKEIKSKITGVFIENSNSETVEQLKQEIKTLKEEIVTLKAKLKKEK